MQRIFSTFPDGWPGYGLLLLRVAGSVPLLVVGVAQLGAEPADIALWLRILGCVSGVLMLAGFWTPLAAALQAILHALFVVSGAAFEWTHLVHASIGLSLVMLGPGYLSIDARLYGRKRIDLSSLPQPNKREPRDP
jgi:uncharacterized membrane protein YphA (DoxX/SURF4 family)